ncbi:hypothetical protein [Spirochaeta cellobiosiphila]|uniref:hypothetical protein n=1 Tax=Spirochaeta cellobiosiphila TaxID=504483 RepID=UPI001B7FEB7C|nr:hypothetical protein [Spirochaeta cellobiosiphila]
MEKRILSIKNLDYDHVNNYLYMNFIIDGNKDIHSFLYRYSLKNSKWEELKELYDNVYKFKSHNSSLILTTMKDSYYYLYNISTGSMDNLKIEKQNGRFLNHVLSFNKSTNDLLSKFIFDDDREMYCLYNLDSEDIRFFDASCTKRKISFEDYALYDNFFIALNKVYQYTSDIYMYSFATSSYKEILTDLPFSIYSLKKYNQDKVVFLAVNERTDNMFLCTKKIVEEGD